MEEAHVMREHAAGRDKSRLEERAFVRGFGNEDANAAYQRTLIVGEKRPIELLNPSWDHEYYSTLTVEDRLATMSNIEKRKEMEKSQQTEWVYIVPATTCKGSFKEMTLRDILYEIYEEINEINARFQEQLAPEELSPAGDVPNRDNSFLQPHCTPQLSPIMEIQSPDTIGSPTNSADTQEERKDDDGSGVSIDVAYPRSHETGARQLVDAIFSPSRHAVETGWAPAGTAVPHLRLRDLRRLTFTLNTDLPFSILVSAK
jgi:hypothetical protein